MYETNTLIHLETLAQILVGNVVALVILYLYGMTLTQSLSLQVIFFITSYIRSYFIRKMFISFINYSIKDSNAYYLSLHTEYDTHIPQVA